MSQGAMDGGVTHVHDVRTGICSSAIARLDLLSRSRSLFPTRLYRFHPWNRTTYIHVSVLHCSDKLHPCNDAIPALPPSMAVVCHKEPRMAV